MEDSRIEKQLKNILGESVVTEPPQSRIEVLVQKIINQGGGSGGGSAEPFFFVADIKGFDQQSGIPTIEETSTTYNDVISKLENGCPMYGHLIVPPEDSSLTMGLIDGIFPLTEVSHTYDSTSGNHEYFVRFGAQMNFHATTPTDVLAMVIGGGGGDITPTSSIS